MSTKEYAVNVLNGLNEGQLIDFLKLFADDNILALAESEIIAKDPNRKHYDSFKDILDELSEDDSDE